MLKEHRFWEGHGLYYQYKFCHSVYCASCTYNDDSFGQRIWRESFWRTLV